MSRDSGGGCILWEAENQLCLSKPKPTLKRLNNKQTNKCNLCELETGPNEAVLTQTDGQNYLFFLKYY